MAADPHPATAELGYLGVAEILTRFDDGSLTSATLVEALLDRIAVVDAPDGPIGLRSVATVATDVRSVASELDAERSGATGAVRSTGYRSWSRTTSR